MKYEEDRDMTSKQKGNKKQRHKTYFRDSLVNVFGFLCQSRFKLMSRTRDVMSDIMHFQF